MKSVEIHENREYIHENREYIHENRVNMKTTMYTIQMIVRSMF